MLRPLDKTDLFLTEEYDFDPEWTYLFPPSLKGPVQDGDGVARRGLLPPKLTTVNFTQAVAAPASRPASRSYCDAPFLNFCGPHGRPEGDLHSEKSQSRSLG